MLSTEYKQAASLAYLEHIKAIANLADMLEAEIALSKSRGLDYVEKIEANKERYSTEIEEADKLIMKLDRVWGDVLRRQYIKRQSQENIADEIGYVVRTVQRFNQNGREELYDFLPEEFK